MAHRPPKEQRFTIVKPLPLLFLVVTTLLAMVIVASPASSAATPSPRSLAALGDTTTKLGVAHQRHLHLGQTEVQATATPPLSADQVTGATIPHSTPTPADCWSTTIPAGAIAGQSAPVFCSLATNGPATSSQDANTWHDEFEHGLSLGNFQHGPTHRHPRFWRGSGCHAGLSAIGCWGTDADSGAADFERGKAPLSLNPCLSTPLTSLSCWEHRHGVDQVGWRRRALGPMP